MANFTQLNLGSKEPQKPSTTAPKRRMMMEEKAVLFGALVIICLTSGAVLLTTQGCSRGADKPATVASQVQQPTPAVAPSTPPPAQTTPAVEAKKKTKRAAIVTYKDANTGLSFRYPRKYTIKTGNAAREELAGLGPVPVNFSEAGGKTLATIEINDTFYPGTDLKAAFVNVSVNPSLDATECSQFAVPVHVEGGTVAASPVSVGDNEYMFVEDFDELNADEPIARYYHKYENGTCYEFALGIATDGNADKEEVRAIDRDAVFEKLTKIVESAQIVSKEKEAAAPTAVAAAQASQPEAAKTESARTEQVQTGAIEGDDNNH